LIEKIKNILVVEDDMETAEMFSEMLKVGGYQVQVCFDGQQARAVLQDSPPDVVVLDMMMPVISGMEVLQFVRNSADLFMMPVVVVSAKGLPGDIEKAVKAGANYYLTKPVSYFDLNRAVEEALNDDD
jgi:CheY-like chemotaxis protein